MLPTRIPKHCSGSGLIILVLKFLHMHVSQDQYMTYILCLLYYLHYYITNYEKYDTSIL